MKTETQHAKFYIKSYRNYRDEKQKALCICHKITCQRFLEFSEEEIERWQTINKLSTAYISTGELEEKITDLKQAIKLYDEAGI